MSKRIDEQKLIEMVRCTIKYLSDGGMLMRTVTDEEIILNDEALLAERKNAKRFISKVCHLFNDYELGEENGSTKVNKDRPHPPVDRAAIRDNTTPHKTDGI